MASTLLMHQAFQNRSKLDSVCKPAYFTFTLDKRCHLPQSAWPFVTSLFCHQLLVDFSSSKSRLLDTQWDKSILKYVKLGLKQLPPIIFCIIIVQDIIQVSSSGTFRPPCYFRNVFWTKSKPAFKLLAEGGRRGKRLFCSSTVIYEIAHCTQTPCQGRVSPLSSRISPPLAELNTRRRGHL